MNSVDSLNNLSCPCQRLNKQTQGLSGDKVTGVLPGGEVEICKLAEHLCLLQQLH